MFVLDTPASVILFFILYGITGAVPLLAAVYLLWRRANAIAPDITPPLRLRRWAASFFIVAALAHVWWFLFLIYSNDLHSVGYVLAAEVDCVGMLTTIAGTLFAMLQDRRRPVWPIVVALVPYVGLGGLFLAYRDDTLLDVAIVYILVLYVLFTVYMAFAVRRYGRWLRDNYADLEHKEVWVSQVLLLAFMLLFLFYTLVDTNSFLIYLLHLIQLALFSLLLWRVETLPELVETSIESDAFEPAPELFIMNPEPPLIPDLPYKARQRLAMYAVIEHLLEQRCVATQLYLQHDLTVLQLAQALGTNRCYLSQYFAHKGVTYNAYINELRIAHFMRLYREAVAFRRSFTAQQLASESGYRSYSTFSLAFKQRTGQSVTAWMHTAE